MTNAEIIASTLDGLLDHEISLVTYGRASIALGFNEKQGLHMTHLFHENQVFLRPEWEQHIVPVLRPPTRWLKLFRPATIDLILTKMIRGNDPQDMADVDFLILHDHITAAQMEPAFATVRIPDIQELRNAFQRALPVVRRLLSTAA